MKPLLLREEARAELLQETRYCEQKREGTGKRFREAVNASFSLILQFPNGGAPGPAATRRSKVRGFPFTVVYREEDTRVVVFAVAPDRQQPGYWLPRAGGDQRL
ncbi:type II toxin-antitoxin system RelE/ParE family toxin [Ideonella sp.]|uniref:type II toxin-antitoxin system RelE/ParE family toxin n=1 Tax=Ideonella sp. TaxID=1929293 RepID=UPI003BB7CD6A